MRPHALAFAAALLLAGCSSRPLPPDWQLQGKPALDAAIRGLEKELDEKSEIEARARRLVEKIALCLQGSLLIRHTQAAVGAAFCRARLDHDGGLAFGTLPTGSDLVTILKRTLPAV